MKCFLSMIFLLSSFLEARVCPSSFSLDDYEHLYYFEVPERDFFPLLLIIEGSFDKRVGPRSILGFHNAIAAPFLKSGYGIATLERKGVKGLEVDEDLFHQSNIPSERIKSHLALVQHLKENPPPGWDGRLIVMGGSEGGPIAIKLSLQIDAEACIVLAGCTDEPFKELIWDFVQFCKASDLKKEHYLPSTREEFDWKCERMKEDPDAKKWWLGQTYLYWSEALEQTEQQEFLQLKCPVFVVAGGKDLKTESTDRLIAKAIDLNRDVTYLRIEEMGHQVLDPQWNVLDYIVEYLQSKVY